MNTSELYVSPDLSKMVVQFMDTPEGKKEELKYSLLTAREAGTEYFNVYQEATVEDGKAKIVNSDSWIWKPSEEWKKKILSEAKNAREEDFFPGWFTPIHEVAFTMIQERLPENFSIHPGGWLTHQATPGEYVTWDDAANVFLSAVVESEIYDNLLKVLNITLKAQKRHA